MTDPIITKIERQKRSRNRVSIFLDDAFAFGIDEETALRFGLAKGAALSETLRGAIEHADAVRAARRKVERLFALRLRSERELRDALHRKGYTEDVAEEALHASRDAGLVDDRAFAEAFVRDRLRFRPRARATLRAELTRKGVARAVADEILARLLDDDGERDTARAVAAKFLRRAATLDADTRRRRLLSLLQRRGYSHAVARAILKESEIEESDNGDMD